MGLTGGAMVIFKQSRVYIYLSAIGGIIGTEIHYIHSCTVHTYNVARSIQVPLFHGLIFLYIVPPLP